MTSLTICRKTMQPCQTPGMCAPFGGCASHSSEPIRQQGWQCPVCKKVSAPWAPSCQNNLCGVDLTVSAVATNQRGGE